MISAQFAKILSDVLDSKTRTILIVLSIMAGLTGVGTILSARTLLAESVARAYADVNYADGSITTKETFDKDFVRSFDDKVDGIQAVDARRLLMTRAWSPSGRRSDIVVYNMPDYADIRVNIVTPESGEWPPPRHQILLEKSSMAVLDVVEGDTILIETTSGTLRSVRVAGSVNDISVPPPSFAGRMYGYVDSDTMEWLGAPKEFNDLSFTVAAGGPAVRNPQQALNAMVSRVEDAGYTVVTSNLVDEIPINSVIQILLLILGAVGALALALSAFLITNSISAIIASQTRLIGVMKAVGASAAQLLWMYLSVSIFYGLIALAAAIPLSVLGANALSEYFARSFHFAVEGSSIQVVSVLAQVILAILVPTLASLQPLLRGLRISATQALGSSAAAQAGSGTNPIDRLLSGSRLWFTRNILMRPVLLAVRNVFRGKLRLALTLVSLVLAGSVFITVFNLYTTVLASMDRMTKMQSYDLEVDLSSDYRIDRLWTEISRIGGVSAMDSWITAPATRIRADQSESGPITVTGLHPDSEVILRPDLVAGRWLDVRDGNAVVITSGLRKKEPDLSVGQVMKLKINDRKYAFLIVGEALAMASGGVGSESAYVNYDYLADVLHDNKTSTSTVLLKLQQGLGMGSPAFKDTLRSQLEDRGFQVASIQTTSETKANMNRQFGTILAILILMALLPAIVGGLGLMGTMTINVIERTREIGVLRAIGASNRGVMLVFMIEGIGIGMTSALLSIPVSIPMTNLAASAFGTLAAGTPWTAVYTSTATILWILLVALLSVLATLIPARRASSLTVREVLAYE